MLAVGRKLQWKKEVPVERGQEERRWWWAFAFPTVGSVKIDMDTAEQGWKCGMVVTPGKKN